MIQDDAGRAFDALDDWITANGWAGYDPYDVRGQDWYVRLFGWQNWPSRKLRGALALIEHRLPPAALRRALRIPKAINAKGMGLLANAYLIRSESSADEESRTKADAILDWLARNPSEGYPGISWGYPFHWQSRVFLPRGTPSVVVTATVGDAWLRHYETTAAADSLKILEGIAEFLTRGLNRPVDDGDRLCFSYTPLDDFKVHNANLFAAAFLAKLGQLTSNENYLDLALRSVRYTLAEQNEDGSFYYWGSEPATIIDHYHTGFVLRHLHTVLDCTGSQSISEPLHRAYDFYLERLFDADGAPRFTPDTRFPIDVHSCAEALLCINQLAPSFGGGHALEPTFRFSQENMLSSDGWYYAALQRRAGKVRAVEIPYLRWGQAWMLLAFASVAAATSGETDSALDNACA